MATVNIGDITIPPADAADTLAAMKQIYASNGIPNPTQAQCLEFERQALIARWKAATRAYRQSLDGVQEPNLT